MNNTNNKIEKILSGSKSNWKDSANYRMRHPWLREYSAQIASRILSAIEEDEDLNQKKIAELLNIQPQQVSKIVQGRENLTLESIYKISKALGIELITFPPYKYSSRAQHKDSDMPLFTETLVSNDLNEIENINDIKYLSATIGNVQTYNLAS